MTGSKQERIKRARQEAAKRQRKEIASLRICFIRSEVMRQHHDALVHDGLAHGGLEYIAESDINKARFITYVAYWFAALATVVERYNALARKGTIPKLESLDRLLTPKMLSLLKPFRNAVAHCSSHDDQRVLNFLENAATVPDWATEVATAFRLYFAKFDEPTE